MLKFLSRAVPYFGVAQQTALDESDINILVNVYIWLKSLFLVAVKGQQLRYLVAHLFMSHWALY